MKTQVLIAQPYYGAINPRCYDACDIASHRGDRVELGVVRRPSSLLANNFNTLFATWEQNAHFERMVILHADLFPTKPAWLDVLMDEADEHNLDALHAVVALKDHHGRTSTAVAYSETDRWRTKRRISTTELQALPETFTIETLRAQYDSAARVLMPNTGCLLLRRGPWVRDFPGFTIDDRFSPPDRDGKRLPQVVPEDWNFGFWAHARGLRVGGTRKVQTRHIGDAPFTTEHGWGDPVDTEWLDACREEQT